MITEIEELMCKTGVRAEAITNDVDGEYLGGHTIDSEELLMILRQASKVQEAEKRNERLKTRRDHLAHRLKIRREENQQYKECEKWLLRIRAEASLQEYPPGVLEYAVAEPEGIYDMVVYLISQNQRYKEALEFYADRRNHEPLLIHEAEYENGIQISPPDVEPPVIYFDKGEKARQALKGESE